MNNRNLRKRKVAQVHFYFCCNEDDNNCHFIRVKVFFFFGFTDFSKIYFDKRKNIIDLNVADINGRHWKIYNFSRGN